MYAIRSYYVSYNYIPSATSLSGMIQEGKQFYKYDESLLTGARFINKFQFFCSLEVVPLTVPNDEEISKLVGYIVITSYSIHYTKLYDYD